MTDEECYAAVADELNDFQRPEDNPPGWGPITLQDLEKRVVERAEKFARSSGIPWPPEIGDFDRYYEWSRNGHRWPLD